MPERKTNGTSPAAVSARLCPTCGKPAVHDFRPFCSKRCADIDLHRWLKGRYAVPVKEDEDEDGSPAGAEGKGAPEEESEH